MGPYRSQWQPDVAEPVKDGAIPSLFAIVWVSSIVRLGVAFARREAVDAELVLAVMLVASAFPFSIWKRRTDLMDF
jgi:hypothetical protein